MKELSRFEIATVKRTAANTKRMRTKKEKLEATVEAASTEIEILQKAIDAFEAPIILLTGGFTSEQVLNGDMDAYVGEVDIEKAAIPLVEVEPETVSETVTEQTIPNHFNDEEVQPSEESVEDYDNPIFNIL